jgi:CBS-domain-containing membrane protein
LHRVGVVDERGQVIGLVSQSKVLAFLYKYSSRLEDSLQAFLRETMDSWIPTHHKNVYTINMNDSVYTAFYRIWEREVSGLAVVDDHGRLVANISASDIKVNWRNSMKILMIFIEN